MSRRLFNLLTLLSLLLCAVVGVLWVRNPGSGPVADFAYGSMDDVWYWPGQTRYFVESGDGLLCFGWHDGPLSSEAICVPHWLAFVAAAALPAVWLVLRARRGRRHRVAGFEVVPAADGPGLASPGPRPTGT